MVAKGYTQMEGVDFTETFSPVAKMIMVHNIIALAASFSWSIYQMDVNNTFLQGDRKEEVYMQTSRLC